HSFHRSLHQQRTSAQDLDVLDGSVARYQHFQASASVHVAPSGQFRVMRLHAALEFAAFLGHRRAIAGKGEEDEQDRSDGPQADALPNGQTWQETWVHLFLILSAVADS